MPVTVAPEEFHFVQYSPVVIENVVTELLDRLGMTGRAVRVEVDETTPLVKTTVTMGDPVVVRADSGAFEDTRHPATLSETAVAVNTGRALLRVRDRETGGFGDAPADEDLSLAEIAAWDAYAVGRLGRAGYEVQEARWRYNFRNRHGFTDVADRAFDTIWGATDLTWAELSALSKEAASTP
jgi:hypothetical protein